ncbi:SAM-dependent methyltransferase [Campylobacter iguaniorum]|uniref:SAM-dependent methyltransferase n=1 Tax=Campylobacter iguaniorum TaxID=1244531 RepID=A0A076F8Z8_9BACT|nr:class I SAM-dependent methyltransferase [Campylobacter iguaniorum]AII13922.1 SAM-dependent methyltransferase [Campylobacter iguaniorum]
MKHQDYIYLSEDYYNKPKQIFSYLLDLLEQNLGSTPPPFFKSKKLLDIGCSRGEFLYFCKKSLKFDTNLLYGLDYSSNLIDEAIKFDGLKGVNFSVGSAENFNLNTQFDIVFMTGVLSYFDDVSDTIKCIDSHLSPNGIAIITGGFNDADVDLITRYRNNRYFNTFEPGWNMHSIHTIRKILKTYKLDIIDIKTFYLSFNSIPQEDPCRSWNIQTENGVKFTNGMSLLYDIRSLIIKRV